MQFHASSCSSSQLLKFAVAQVPNCSSSQLLKFPSSWQSDFKFGKIGGGVVMITTLCRWRHDRGGEIDRSFNWNEVKTVPSFRIGGEVIEKEVESEVQEQREGRGRRRKSSFENGRGSLGRS